MIRIKRVFEKRAEDDGYRVLVDRLWPRGVRKEAAALGYWAKELSPSSELRKFYHHDPRLWNAFQGRFREELKNNPAAIETLTRLGELAKTGTVTLLYGSRETVKNNAAVVKDILEAHF
ncbi:MAG: DUF488 domain-containing protein [Elusimicrobiota bacterium]